MTLIETYRHEPSMKSFAADMLSYMVTGSITKDHVLNVCSKRRPPITIFSVLHLNDDHGRVDLDDMTVVTAWLKYSKLTFQSGASNFRVADFILLQVSMMSVPRARAMFESNALKHVLGDVEHETGNLATYLRDLCQGFPLHISISLRLLGKKITDENNPFFLSAIYFIAAYMGPRPDKVYELLKPIHSFDEVNRMFKTFKNQAERFTDLSARQRTDVKIFAGKMVQYLSRSFQLLSLSKLHPGGAWNTLLQKCVDTNILMEWLKYSVLSHSRGENNSVEKAMPTVLKALREKKVNKEISSKLWLSVLKELRKEHGPLWNMLKRTLAHSRKRKTNSS